MPYPITTQKALRAAFWQGSEHLRITYSRDGQISDALAARATL